MRSMGIIEVEFKKGGEMGFVIGVLVAVVLVYAIVYLVQRT